MFFVYILRCADRSFYIGHSEDLEARILAHETGQVRGYTSSRRPVHLVWSQSFATRIEALECERQLKGWSRAKKEALIRGDWAALRRLARSHGIRPSASSGRTEEPPPT